MARYGEERNNNLPDLIKAVAYDLIDLSDDISKGTELLGDFDIWLRFPADGAPSIEVSRINHSKRAYEVIRNYYSSRAEKDVKE